MKFVRHVLLCLAVFLLSLPLLGGEADPVPEENKALIGAWQNEADAAYFLLFTPAKCAWTDKSGPQFARVKYFPGLVAVRVLGAPALWQVEVKDNRMTLTQVDFKKKTIKEGTKPSVWKKLDQVPKELDIQPLAFGEAKPVPVEQRKALQEEFKQREKLDQDVRKDPAKQADMGKVDADNTAFLKKTVQELGWIDAGRFGAQASNTAFLIVQHSGDMPLMLAALPAIEKDVKAKLVDGGAYALLYDRVKLNLGEKQRYGSQIARTASGEMVVLTLEDKAKVDQFRKEMGMTPLAQYLAFFKGQNGGKDVKFADDLETEK
jgi:hypothetical protein